jgi:hypothetical protein
VKSLQRYHDVSIMKRTLSFLCPIGVWSLVIFMYGGSIWYVRRQCHSESCLSFPNSHHDILQPSVKPKAIFHKPLMIGFCRTDTVHSRQRTTHGPRKDTSNSATTLCEEKGPISTNNNQKRYYPSTFESSYMSSVVEVQIHHSTRAQNHSSVV